MTLLLPAVVSPTVLRGQQSRVPKDQPQICTYSEQGQETEGVRLKIDNHSNLSDADCPQTGSDSDKAVAESGQSAAETSPDELVVRYRGGLLSVSSSGATLQAILDQIREDAGISISATGDALQQQVFDKVGPAPLRDALVSLLYGTGFNYIIQSNPSDLQHVSSVIVTPETPPSSQASPTQTAASEENEGPGVYSGVQGIAEPASTAVSGPVAPVNSLANPSNVPGIPAGFDLQKTAAAENKTPAEVLSDLQRKQIELLDAQAPQE